MNSKADPPALGNRNTEIVEKALTYAREIFRDPGFIPFSRELIEKIGCYPNSMCQANKDIGRIRVLISFRSERGEWGLNRAGLDYLLAAEQQQKIAVGVVMLTADYRTTTNVAWITPVMDTLRDAPLRQGRHGPYYWVDQSFRPAPPRGSGVGYITDPDVPF